MKVPLVDTNYKYQPQPHGKTRWEFTTVAVTQCRYCDYLYMQPMEGHKLEVKEHMTKTHSDIDVTYRNKSGNFAKL